MISIFREARVLKQQLLSSVPVAMMIARVRLAVMKCQSRANQMKQIRKWCRASEREGFASSLLLPVSESGTAGHCSLGRPADCAATGLLVPDADLLTAAKTEWQKVLCRAPLPPQALAPRCSSQLHLSRMGLS